MSEAYPNRSLFDRAYALLLWLLLGAFLVYGLGVLHHGASFKLPIQRRLCGVAEIARAWDLVQGPIAPILG